MNYIYIWYKLVIRANTCEGDYVYGAYTIIVGDTSSCLHNYWLLLIMLHMYISSIYLRVYIYI